MCQHTDEILRIEAEGRADLKTARDSEERAVIRHEVDEAISQIERDCVVECYGEEPADA